MKNNPFYASSSRRMCGSKAPLIIGVFLLIILLVGQPIFAEEQVNQTVNEEVSQEAFSETNTETNQDITTDITPVNDDTENSEISMDADEKSKKDVSSTDPTLPFNPNQTPNIIRPEVDQTTGALTHNYSFDLPKGINNFSPDVALRYNSQDTRKDSVIGYGWSFNIPYIIRETKRGTDKIYDNNDFVSSVDGELTAIDANHFGPKSDDGSMHNYFYSNNSFSLIDKSGVTYTYGGNINSRQDDSSNANHIFKWMLSSVVDANGNIISYTYFKEQGQIYPNTISYNQTGDNVLIEFNHISRSNSNVLYTPAFKVRTLQRISDVKISIGGTLVKKYTISIADNLIKSILLEGYKAGQAFSLPPVQFDYSLDGGTREWSVDSNFQLPTINGQVLTLDYNSSYSQYGNSFRDINGDGLPDIVRWIIGQPNGYSDISYGNQVFLNTGSSFVLAPNFLLPTDSNGKVVALDFNNGSTYGNSFRDVNADGLVDVVRWAKGQPNGYVSSDLKSGNQVFLNTGSGFVLAPNFLLPTDSSGKIVTLDYNYKDASVNYGSSFRDINGDRLPDIVRWTMGQPNGYISSDLKSGNQVFLNTGSSFVLAPNFLLPTDSNGKVLTLDYNYTFQYGNSFLDINGDGLPDIVRWTTIESNGYSNMLYGNQVFLNTGSSFVLAPNFLLPTDSTGKVLALDYNYNAVSGNSFRDINGDGLPDIIRWIAAQPNGYSSLASGNQVFLNTGIGFEFDSNFLLPTDSTGKVVTLDYSYLSLTESFGNFFRDVNGDGLVDVVRWAKGKPNGYASQTYGNQVFLNTGSSLTIDSGFIFPTINGQVPALDLNYSSQYGNSFRDINGDGLPDIVRWATAYSNGYSSLTSGNQIFINKIGRKEISKITDGPGAVHTFFFKGIRAFTNSQNVGVNANILENYETFVVSSSNTNDNNGNIGNISYEYQQAYYYFNTLFSKKFAGFERTTMTLPNGNKETVYFHEGNDSNATNFEYDDHVSKIGKIYRKELRNSSGILLTSTTTKYEKNQLSSLAGDRYFVYPVQIVSEIFSGTTKAIANTDTFNLTTGNLTTHIDWGEVIANNPLVFSDTGTDKRTINYTYANNGANVYALSQETYLNQSNEVYAETRHYYDNQILGVLNNGNETKTEKLKLPSVYVSTQNIYDNYGNVVSHTDENNKTTIYTIDSFHLYPILITSPALFLGSVITKSMTYDYSVGKPITVTDNNGFITEYSYDAFGRISTVKIPDPSATLPSAPRVLQKSFSYVDIPNAVAVSEINFLSDILSFQSLTYFDSLGREIQTRVSAEGSQWKVSDTIYDTMGRISKTSIPYFSSGIAKTSPTTLSYQLITNSYDALSRLISIVDALGTTLYSYSGFTKTITDASNHTKDFTFDVFGNLIQVAEHNGTSTYLTNYNYDGNNNLIKITDALGNVRDFTYDLLGRRITAKDLHTLSDNTFGLWTYSYDDAGNMIQSISPEGEIVNYTYDALNRVLTEDYLGTSDLDIYYLYDSSCANSLGKLCSVFKAGANTNYTYNSDGLIATENKIIDNITYTTSYKYDFQGNIASIIYPDNSKVKYTYNNGGLLEKIETKESGGILTDVVSNFDYSPTDQITTMVYPNGVTTSNTYDATKLYRLTNKKTLNAGQSKFQDLTYSYSPVGNITSIVDASNTNTAKSTSYQYDDLYRLTSATVTGSINGQNYSEMFTYDAVGNILNKSNINSYSYKGNQGLNYANPHAVTEINSPNYSFNFTYDKKGNLIQKTSTTFATLNSSVSGNGHNTDAWFETSTGEQLGFKTIDSGTSSLSYVWKGLMPNQTYSFRVVAKNEMGITYGDWVSFTTIAGLRPNIFSATVSPGVTSAIFNGSVNPSGLSTDAWYESSRTGTQQLQLTHLNDCNTTAILPSYTINKLKPESSYKFRVVARNESGTTYGEWINFQTKSLLVSEEDRSPIIFSTTATPNTPLSLFNTSDYNWNYRNELTRVSSESNNDVYTYDHSGNRIKAVVDGVSTLYPNKSYSVSGNKKTKYVYAGDTLVATINTVGSVVTPNYIHTDHLGGTNVVSNAGGGTIQTIDYYPYGAERICSGGSCDIKKKYIGQYSDTDTALDYLNARYYDGTRGRFISQDPQFWGEQNLMDPQSLNSYSYARNNPVMMKDPSGEFGINSIPGLMIGGVKGAINMVGDLFNMVTHPVATAEGLYNFGKTTIEHPSGTYNALLNGAVDSWNQFTNSSDLNQGVMLGEGAFFVGSLFYGEGEASGASKLSKLSKMEKLSDATLVCRGGLCTDAKFLYGTGVKIGEDGIISGVSVRVGINGESKAELLKGLPAHFNGQGEFTTLGEIRKTDSTLIKTGKDPLHFEWGGYENDFWNLFKKQ